MNERALSGIILIGGGLLTIWLYANRRAAENSQNAQQGTQNVAVAPLAPDLDKLLHLPAGTVNQPPSFSLPKSDPAIERMRNASGLYGPKERVPGR